MNFFRHVSGIAVKIFLLFECRLLILLAMGGSVRIFLLDFFRILFYNFRNELDVSSKATKVIRCTYCLKFIFILHINCSGFRQVLKHRLYINLQMNACCLMNRISVKNRIHVERSDNRIPALCDICNINNSVTVWVYYNNWCFFYTAVKPGQFSTLDRVRYIFSFRSFR